MKVTDFKTDRHRMTRPILSKEYDEVGRSGMLLLCGLSDRSWNPMTSYSKDILSFTSISRQTTAFHPLFRIQCSECHNKTPMIGIQQMWRRLDFVSTNRHLNSCAKKDQSTKNSLRARDLQGKATIVQGPPYRTVHSRESECVGGSIP